jgi:hypothetical protein
MVRILTTFYFIWLQWWRSNPPFFKCNTTIEIIRSFFKTFNTSIKVCGEVDNLHILNEDNRQQNKQDLNHELTAAAPNFLQNISRNIR